MGVTGIWELLLDEIDMIDYNDELPAPYEWYEHQVAGHHPSVVKNGQRQIGIIKGPSTSELLKVVGDSRGLCEERLYKDINDAKENNRVDLPEFYNLYDLVPRFYGLESIVIGKNQKVYDFLRLEDVICSYSQPCVLDVKIGRVSFDPNASEEKRMTELKKSAFQRECGFRILGYRISTNDATRPKIKDKEWGRNLDADTIDDAFAEFLDGRPKDFDRLALEFLHRMKLVKSYFNTQTSLQFYASSLLFVYESDPKRKPSVDLRMIDFSHVFREPNVRDDNYLTGVHYICGIFSRLLQKHSSIIEGRLAA